MAMPNLSKWPAQHSPPDRSGKTSKAEEANCLVCEKIILEADDETDGHEALFCVGDCQGCIHRQCAGIRWIMTSLVSQPYLFYVIIDTG